MTSLHGVVMGEGSLSVDGQMWPWAPREPNRLDAVCLQPQHLHGALLDPHPALQRREVPEHSKEERGMKTFWDAFWMSFSLLCCSSPLGREERRWECVRFAVLFFPGVFARCEPELLCSSPAFPEQSVGTGPPLAPTREDTQPSHVLVLGWG